MKYLLKTLQKKLEKSGFISDSICLLKAIETIDGIIESIPDMVEDGLKCDLEIQNDLYYYWEIYD